MSKRSYATESAGPGLAVDREAEIPIGVQLAWALRARIRDGAYRPGQRLPGLRELAQATGVNVNTVRSVYQRLERDGLVDSQQGSGTFVAAAPGGPSALAAIVAAAMRDARESGVDPREVAAALYVAPGPPARAAAPVQRRRLLREQIAALERTLVELEAKHPGLLAPSRRRREGGGPALLDEAELERVRDTLVRRLGALQAAIDELTRGRVGVPATTASDEREQAGKRSTGKAGGARARPSARPAAAGA
ncbi:MAG TPA: GntR family transcriptional regulator [Solirubrobacteraceae bacterium]|nr:GntR family transcriptional regulator [Solirubrobacteraceae bacterium]